MSDSVQPHRRQPTRLLRPWYSPGKNTGVGCHFLFQCMKVKSESEVAQSCRTLSDPMDCSVPGSSVHGIFHTRVLEWVANAFSPLVVQFSFSSVAQTYPTLCDPMNRSTPGLPGHHQLPGEGNGNPLQYSCLENPVHRGALWAAVHRVAQSRTQLKRLSMHACIGEGNGNPLQYSCLENPRYGASWWAVVCGVAQSRTRLKQLSSSSSSNN